MRKTLHLYFLRLLRLTPARGAVEERLIHEWRLLLTNWILQRLLGNNKDVPWSVHYTSQVVNPDKIRLGLNVKRSFALSGNCYIQAGNGLEIGDRTIFAPGVKIITANHGLEAGGREWTASNPVVIGCDCWLGSNAVILPGVELGDRVIVGAGSVVTKSFPADVVVVGNPAKVIRNLAEVEQGR